MKQITFITCSMKKIAEVRGIFGSDSPFEIIHKKLDLNEYQGDDDFIVREKCKLAAKVINGPVIVEDTSVKFMALKGLPGPYIKWFDETIGALGMWRILKDYDDKRATAYSKLAFCEGPDASIHVFDGSTSGTIVEPRGEGFTWTACFKPDSFELVYDEMDLSLKVKISERFEAVNELKKFLLTNYRSTNGVTNYDLHQ